MTSEYFTNLGGTRTAELVNVLDDLVMQDDNRDIALGLAHAIQDGLAVGSQSWNTTQAEQFGASLLDAASAGGAIAYLFGAWDSNPMGEALTVYMATRIDEIERAHGANWWGSTTTGAAYLVGGLHPEDPWAMIGPGDAVMGASDTEPDHTHDARPGLICSAFLMLLSVSSRVE